MAQAAADSSVLIANNTFIGNTATGHGGGVAITGDEGSATVTNNIIWANTAQLGGYDGDDLSARDIPALHLSFNILGRKAQVETGVSQDLLVGPGIDYTHFGNLTRDPRVDAFIDRLAPGRGHFPLRRNSPAIDAAAAAACPDIDQLDRRRPLDGDRNGTARCDIGAIEFKPNSR